VDASRPDAERDGDEPALLARSLPDVPVVVSPDRVRGAEIARRRNADVLLLDDGFQHRRMHRDLDVVLWDEGAVGSRGRLLPEGFLREPMSALARADLLLRIDRGNGLPPAPPLGPPPERTFCARLVCGARQRLEEGMKVHALSGIADPASFERALADLGLEVTGATRHADHHRYSADEVRQAARRGGEEGAGYLAVTAKDFVRWPRDCDPPLPVPAVFDLEVEVEAEDRFLQTLESVLAGEER
jgi:tetraacyldisaccharide 4'-kinase